MIRAGQGEQGGAPVPVPVPVPGREAADRSALQALERAVRDTTRLTRLLTVLSARAPVVEVLDQALSTLSELFAADVVALLARGADGAFSALAAIGIPEHLLAAPIAGAPPSRAAEVLATGAAVVLPDATDDAGIDPHLRELELRAAAWLPVLADGEAPIVLFVARCAPAPFAAADLDLLGAMAYRIGLLLERARTEAALRDAHERLLQAEKLALAGQLAGSVAHEVNNPLACVLANASALRDHLPAIAATFRAAAAAAEVLGRQPGEEARAAARALREALDLDGEGLPAECGEILSDLADGTQRIVRLVGAFKALSSPDRRSVPEPVDLRALVAACTLALPAEPGAPRVVVEGEAPCVGFASPALLEAGLLGLLRFLVGPSVRREGVGAIVARAAVQAGGPCILLSDPTAVMSEDERRRLFDPRLEEVETSAGRSVRLTVAAALACQMLRHAGAEPTTAPGPDGRGLRIWIRMPAP